MAPRDRSTTVARPGTAASRSPLTVGRRATFTTCRPRQGSGWGTSGDGDYISRRAGRTNMPSVAGSDMARIPASAHSLILTAGTTILLSRHRPPTLVCSGSMEKSTSRTRAASSSTGNRMVKMSASFVLASFRSQRTPGVRLDSSLAAASLDGHFDHSARSRRVLSDSALFEMFEGPTTFSNSLLSGSSLPRRCQPRYQVWVSRDRSGNGDRWPTLPKLALDSPCLMAILTNKNERKCDVGTTRAALGI